MQRTHGFSGNRLTRALRTGAIALTGAIFALAMQPMHGWAQETEFFVSGLWEHKIEIHLTFKLPKQTFSDAIINPELPESWHEWNRGGLPELRKELLDEADWACGFYGRRAVGPIYAVNEGRYSITTLTYACALP